MSNSNFPSNFILTDQIERESIERDLDVSMLVEAAAGTGKTTCMVNRMIALLRTGKAVPSDIAAITFTRKAAAQLRQRFQIELERAISSQQISSETKALLSNALQHIDHTYIGTVHSFCSRLLRERPVEGGIDPNFVELDETDDALLQEEFWTHFLEDIPITNPDTMRSLENIGVSISSLKEFFKLLVLFPEVDHVVVTTEPPEYETTLKLLTSYIEKARNGYSHHPSDGRFDSLQELCEKQYRLRNVLDINEIAQVMDWIAGFDKKVSIIQKLWLDNAVAKTTLEIFQDLHSNLIQPLMTKWRRYCHPIIMQVVLPAAKRLEAFRKETGQLNFQDLLLLTCQMLRNYPEVRSDFQNRFRYILVDEFQDTDPLQAEILFYLTGLPVEEKDWQNLKIKPGSLFIVGDPKQSIYRFRRADIAIYQQVKELLQQSGGCILNLSSNFRSHQSICNWVNTSFETIFTNSENPYQALNVPLRATREDSPYPVGVFTLTTKVESRANREVTSNSDAENIARIISNWLTLKTNIRPQDFLILLREKRSIKTYIEALERYGIPYEVAGSNAFNDAEEFDQLLQLLRTISDPDDQVALVAFLQGPLCGISDESLYRFRVVNNGQFDYRKDVSDNADPSIKDAYSLLRLLKTEIDSVPAGTAISRIIERSGLLPFAATKPLGNLRSGTLVKLLTIARAETATGCSFGEVIAKIQKLKEVVEIEAMTLQQNRTKAVRLMNLHKAKGLEAPIVFLADPHEAKEFEPSFVIDRIAGTPKGYFLVQQKSSEFHSKTLAEPVDWEKYKVHEGLFECAEQDRLRYVAATRAADCLVVSRLEVATKTEVKRFCQWIPELRSLERCPEIYVPTEVETSEPVPVTYARDNEFNNEIASIELSKLALAEPSYHTTSVTAIIHPNGKENIFTTNDSDRGLSWGVVIHRALQWLANKGEIQENILNSIVEENGFERNNLSTLLTALNSVKKTDLWKRMYQSEEKYTELPFANYDKASNSITHGVIDLIFREQNQWTIVDYKSDRVMNRLNELTMKYRLQIESYVDYWNKMTGEKSIGFLLFTDTCQAIQVSDQ